MWGKGNLEDYWRIEGVVKGKETQGKHRIYRKRLLKGSWRGDSIGEGFVVEVVKSCGRLAYREEGNR